MYIIKNTHPLLHPDSKSETKELFLNFFGISPHQNHAQLLYAVTKAFSNMPFENLTKIIKRNENSNSINSKRHPAEVILGHKDYGSGGTCFALTAAFLHIARALGFRAEPVLADRKYGADTHSALLIWIKNKPCLIDPGYLILNPVSIDINQETHIQTSFNELILIPRKKENKIDLYTIREGHKKYRLSFKTTPSDPGNFLHAWETSFDLDMMHYPLLTKIEHGRQIYLQKNNLHIFQRNKTQSIRLNAKDEINFISSHFNISQNIILKALNILKQKGEFHG